MGHCSNSRKLKQLLSVHSFDEIDFTLKSSGRKVKHVVPKKKYLWTFTEDALQEIMECAVKKHFPEQYGITPDLVKYYIEQIQTCEFQYPFTDENERKKKSASSKKNKFVKDQIVWVKEHCWPKWPAIIEEVTGSLHTVYYFEWNGEQSEVEQNKITVFEGTKKDCQKVCKEEEKEFNEKKNLKGKWKFAVERALLFMQKSIESNCRWNDFVDLEEIRKQGGNVLEGMSEDSESEAEEDVEENENEEDESEDDEAVNEEGEEEESEDKQKEEVSGEEQNEKEDDEEQDDEEEAPSEEEKVEEKVVEKKGKRKVGGR